MEDAQLMFDRFPAFGERVDVQRPAVGDDRPRRKPQRLDFVQANLLVTHRDYDQVCRPGIVL